jgi:hypothetical protein
MRSFGRVMPIHIDLLQLAGYAPAWAERDIRPAATDEEYLRAMRAGRAALRRATSQDFGYDLAAWREFLSSAPDDEFGYQHPYAFSGVDRAVRQAIRRRRRRQLVERLKQPEAEPGDAAAGGGM